MLSCPDIAPAAGMALRIYTSVDCHAQALGGNGFEALAGSSLFAQLLSGAMIVAVALVGYRLMLGDSPTTRNGVLWVLRLGVVLALTTGWTAYGTLFYRVSFDGPGELAAIVLPVANLGEPQALVERMQGSYDAFVAAGQAASQNDPVAAPPAPASADPVAAPAVPAVGGEWSLRPLAFAAAGIALLVTGLGSLLAAKLASGLLLALGPLFVAAMLLDATLGLFESWLRALMVAVLGALGSMAVLSVELTLLEREMAFARNAANSSAVDPAGIVTIVALFSVVLLVIWVASVRVVGRIRLPRTMSSTADRAGPAQERADRTAPVPAVAERGAAGAVEASSATRVRTVAEAISRRERQVSRGGGSGAGVSLPSPVASASVDAPGSAPPPTMKPYTPGGRRPTWRTTA